MKNNNPQVIETIKIPKIPNSVHKTCYSLHWKDQYLNIVYYIGKEKHSYILKESIVKLSWE